MILKKLIHLKKKEYQPEKATRRAGWSDLTDEDLHQIAMEMSWGYGMLPPGALPDEAWHFY